MILLFSSDFHGSARHYDALSESIQSIRPALVILGGDLFPDDPSEKPDEMGKHQPLFVLEHFRTWLTGVLKASPAIQVLAIFGNHDWMSTAAAMEELARQQPRLILLQHQHAVGFGGVAFVGYSRTPPTPWYVKDFERLDMPHDPPPFMGGARWDARYNRASQAPAKKLYAAYPSIAEELEKMIQPQPPWVFVAHAPPHDTALDRSYRRESLGSRGVRAAIEKRQPMLSLHGHIHESPEVTGQYRQTLGQTVAVNVGQQTRVVCQAVIEIDPAAGRVVRVERRQSQ
ncbi:MAG: metallophosphoesterase [Phycisphaerae bacterium]|nr:metallophosphoesterase [Phycisphaerae bacterium]